MTPLVFDPSKVALQRMARLSKGSPWSEVQDLMACLSGQGFSKPCSEEYSPREFTQSSGPVGSEVAMLYASQDDEGLLFTAGLSWAVSEGFLATQIASVVDGLLARMRQALGEPAAALNLANEWVKNGCDPDVIVCSCFWSPGAGALQTQAASDAGGPPKLPGALLSLEGYRKELGKQARAITLSVEVTPDHPGAMSTWSVQAILSL